MTGVRAEFVFEGPECCPVATASAETKGPIQEVSWAREVDGTVTEQFTATDEPTGTDADPIFDYGTQQVYEFERDSDEPCICEVVEQLVGPVTEVYADDGNLHVTLHAGDIEDLRSLIGTLNERFERVRIEYLVQSREKTDESDLVPVDMRLLTDRQREVLRTAHKMGYFEYPRDSNASEVAERLGIQPSTFTEHLNAAQSKLLDELLVRA